MSNVDSNIQRRHIHTTREEEADRCLNHTTYSKGTAGLIAAFFLTVVFGVPIVQHVVEIRQNLARRAAWSAKSGQPEPRLLPQVYDVFSLLPTGEQIKKAKGFWGYWSLIPSGAQIDKFETALKESSVLTKEFLSPTQSVMSGVLGVGNEKAYCGTPGWLFYRPDVEYLTTDGFLNAERLRLLSHGATQIQPNPVKAILDLNDQLKTRGIELVVMPMTTKPMVEPEKLAGDSAKGINLQNPSFAKFQETLESNGVKVFDPTPILLQDKMETNRSQFLETDTHWTPSGMESVAFHLARFLQSRFTLPTVESPHYIATHERISNLGDIAEMLKLPKDQTLYGRQEVTIQKVSMADGTPWLADHSADVLLLGDSFANIYSREEMGWGTSAGLAEQLSYILDRPVDKIVINAGGAFASRRELARSLASGEDRLAGKRIAIYEFSMRDLAEGDWKMIHLPQPPKGATVLPTPSVDKGPGTISSKPIIVGAGNSTNPAKPGNPIAPLTGSTKPVVGSTPQTGSISNAGVKPGVGNTPGHPKPNIEIPGKSETVPVIPTKKPDIASTKPSPTKPDKSKPAAAGLIVTGRIAARANTPKPGSVPYKDCLIALQLTDLKVSGGSIPGPNIIVYVWGMKDNQLVDDLYSVGQTLTFKLAPWASVESKYGGLNRQELESDEALSWAAFWGEVSK